VKGLCTIVEKVQNAKLVGPLAGEGVGRVGFIRVFSSGIGIKDE